MSNEERNNSNITLVARVLWVIIIVAILSAILTVFSNPPKLKGEVTKTIIFEGDTIMTNEFGEVINIK